MQDGLPEYYSQLLGQSYVWSVDVLSKNIVT